MKLRKTAGMIVMALTAVLTVYFSAVMIHRISTVVLKGSYVIGFCLELVICLFFFVLGLDLKTGFFTRSKNRAVKATGWILRIVTIAVTSLILILTAKIVVSSFANGETDAKNVLVLGLALQNGRPADDLLARLDTAEKYQQENPQAMLVLTGGNAGASGKTEADVMYDILCERGIQAGRMKKEDRAENTEENFRNAAEMIDPDEPCAVITSNYHMDRALGIARKAGFKYVYPCPAPSSKLYYGANVMWEAVMEMAGIMLGH